MMRAATMLLLALGAAFGVSRSATAQESYQTIKVTTSPAEDTHPAWTADGQSLIYETDRDHAIRLDRAGGKSGLVAG